MSPYVGSAALVAAVVAITLVGYERRLGREMEAGNQALTTARMHIDSVTAIRRDARKTYVKVLERWLQPDESRAAAAASARTQAQSVVAAAGAFSRMVGHDDEETELRKTLSLIVEQWAQAIEEAAVAPSTPNSLARLQPAVGKFDSLAESLVRLNSDAARRCELRELKLKRADAQAQTALGALMLATVFGIIVWRLGMRASRQSEARYTELFERISDGVILFAATQGADFVIRDVNRATLRMEGLSRHQLVGHRLTEVFAGAREYGLLDALSRVHASGVAEHLPSRLYQDERISGWRETAVYRLPSGEVVAVCRDVTAQKVGEEQLLAQTRLMKALLAGIPSPVFYKGVDGRYLGCNPAFEEFLGRKAEDIVGRMVGEVWPEPYATIHRNQDLALLRNPGRRQYESQLVDSKGAARDFVFCKSTFRGSDGQIAGVVSVMLDITERKQRERMEMELRQAQKLQAVGQLAAGIAHEINTPVQYVGDSLHFLKESSDALSAILAGYRSAVEALTAIPGQRGLVEEIRKNEESADMDYVISSIPDCFARCFEGVARIATIVRAMKEFAHPDQREMSPADLNQALRNTLTICANEYKYIAEAQTELNEIPLVVCHLGDVSQVFLNLIVNAAHAISDMVGNTGAKGKITVSTRAEAGSVCIQIADTGTGIPEHMREHIFEPFFTTKPVGKGTGQGLAIARSVVVDKHGGTLTFESKVGEGTIFTIRLPIDGKTAVINPGPA